MRKSRLVRTGRAWSAAMALAAPLCMGVESCDEDEVVVGEQVQCEVAGQTYDAGDSVPSADCNTCTCMDDGYVACTTIGCDPGDPNAEGCDYNDNTYAVGDSFPATDGCNTCFCDQGGLVACTEIACAAQCEYDGNTYAAGESFPATDGCNTCTCDAGGLVACTEIGCIGQCEYDGNTYAAGESFPSTDGCNTCSCDASGLVACTARACIPTTCEYQGQTYDLGDTFDAGDGCNTCSCGPNGDVGCTDAVCTANFDCPYGDSGFNAGDTFVCDDGCNTCTCSANGLIASTRIDCGSLPPVQECDPVGSDEVTVSTQYLNGDALSLVLSHSGGCEDHDYRLCFSSAFLESSPVQVSMWVEHTKGADDPCEAIVTSERVWDLGPIRDAWREAYQQQSGQARLNIGDRSPLYSF